MTQPWSGNWQLALFTLHWFSLKLDLTPSCQISHIWHLLLRIKIKVDTFFSELTQDQQTFLIAISWWQIWKGEKVEALHIWTPPLFLWQNWIARSVENKSTFSSVYRSDARSVHLSNISLLSAGLYQCEVSDRPDHHDRRGDHYDLNGKMYPSNVILIKVSTEAPKFKTIAEDSLMTVVHPPATGFYQNQPFYDYTKKLTDLLIHSLLWTALLGVKYIWYQEHQMYLKFQNMNFINMISGK